MKCQSCYLNTMHDKDVHTFFGIMGGKAGLQGMFDALNSDGALGQLNYWKGENTVMEDEQVWFGESRRSHVLDLLTQLLFTLYILRSGVRAHHAAYDFGISEATASRYFSTWLSVLNERIPSILSSDF